MAISSAGIGSGLDVNAIVSQLVAIERQPIVQLQSEASRLQTRISAFGRVHSTMSTLRDAAAKLALPETWRAATAATSDTAIIGTTASGSAQPGIHTVVVDKLATAQTLASPTYASAATSVGSGILRIELGDFDVGGSGAKAGATAVDIEIDPSASSLTAVRDKINGAGAGVTASIVNDISGARLVLRSAETGRENGFRVEVLQASGHPGNTTGLETLAFDPRTVGGSMTRSQNAANAKATIDGIAVESASNVMEGTIEGLTLALRREGQAEVRVEPDTDALKKSVDAFAAAFNETVKLLREQTSYDPTTKKAGALQGDGAGTAVLTQLRNLFTAATGASASFTRMADIGLALGTDGTVKVDDTKLGAALANQAEMSKLFANADVKVESQGMAKRFKSWLDNSLGNDGTLDSRTQSLQARVRNNEQAQARLEDRVARTQLRLQRQYTALDTRMGQLSGLSDYVSQQMSLLNANSSNR